MSQVDLYSLLKGFARKIKSSTVSIDEFLGFIEKYAARKAPLEHEWAIWTGNAQPSFYEKLPDLVEQGYCILLPDGRKGRLFMPFFCREQIVEAYSDVGKLANSPLPNEETLNLGIPPGFTRAINLSYDMGLFFEEYPETPDPGEIISLQFPLGYGSALLLASMIPRKLMELALFIIQNYLRTSNNKDYAYSRLSGQMQGKENILRDAIDRIAQNPLGCLGDMEQSADFPFLFWTFFCPLVKSEIGKKNSLAGDDLATLQAVSIIEVCCSFYRAQAVKKRELDAAYMALDTMMNRPPWRYTLEDIIDFTNDQGVPLLEIYSQADLEEYIQNSINDGQDDILPSWLVIPGERKGDRWFVKKERYLHICAKLILEARAPIKTMLEERWMALEQDCTSEAAMKSDPDFEKLLIRLTRDLYPDLLAMLRDPKLYLAYLEHDRIPGAAQQSSQIFKDGALLPYSVLYGLRRKDMLRDVKLKFPIWHSIPLLVSFYLLLKNLGIVKKSSVPVKESGDRDSSGRKPNELRESARMIEAVLVPRTRTLDEYLGDLEKKWARLLNKKARQNLILDVQSLLRDNLRKALRVYKLKRITREGLQEMSDLLIKRNPGLSSLSDQESLRLYMELYMLKLLLGRKM